MQRAAPDAMPLAQVLPANIFAVSLVFARVGSALMLLPGFGDLYVPQRYRLLLALLLSLLVAAAVAPDLPGLPADPPTLLVLLFGEIVVGFFLGTVARLLLMALETAGGIISLQLGLSSAQVFNPAFQQQSAITGTLLVALGTLVIFLTNTHHLLLRAVVESYGVFIPGRLPAPADLSEMVTRVVAQSFRLGFELAAPFIVAGTIFFAALGLIARLMPQLQVFFIVVPLQIAAGLALFGLTLAAVMNWFLDDFTRLLGRFIVP
jgi:flagellar biosynthetic protein FliR